MTRIIWLASYPRSGNTWLRFLLYNLYHGAPFASHQVDKFIPSFHNGVKPLHFAGGRAPIVKTHLCYDVDMPLAECTIGAIYVYRHPLPVMASNVRYVMRLFPYEDLSMATRRELVGKIVTEFIDNCGLVGWHQAGYGSWEENLRSWLDADLKFPVLALRYEDLVRDPLTEIDRICDFLGLGTSPADRAAAVQNASEKTLMAMEEREIHYNWPGMFGNLIKGGSRKWRFVRDSSLEPLVELVPPALLARAADVLATPAKQFGYESPRSPERQSSQMTDPRRAAIRGFSGCINPAVHRERPAFARAPL